MSSSANKGIALKTMDIKTALLNCSSRKRKVSSSQDGVQSDVKSRKISSENENEVQQTCVIKLDQNALHCLGDCKENKDVNAISVSCDVNKSACEPMVVDNLEVKNIETGNELESDAKSKSDHSSSDELNSTLNTSGISVIADGEEKHEEENSLNEEKSCQETEKTVQDQKIKKRKMTAAEAKKKSEEREQKQKQKLLKKEELEKKKRDRQLEKEKKQKERLQKENERKERERLKQEKKEQEEKEKLLKQKEKEEKLKIKQQLLEQKIEEKKKKEEMRLKREEELKKAEEEKMKLKLEKEQKEREKKEKAKAAFVKFFVKGDSQNILPAPQPSEKEGVFLPFQVSDDMILAPAVPLAAQERFDKKNFEKCLENQNSKELYLQILKSGSYKDVKQRKKIRKLGTSETDVIVIDKNAEAELDLRPKLLQFCENVRPPFWGTWRKKSKNINPRNPFGQDEIFDYDVDSDEEWDEGGPGESLSGTENEDESEDEYEVDNEFFVPHGYLSDEEEKKEEDELEDDPEKVKERLKAKLQEFEMERKKKTTILKPIILGCYFTNDPNMQDGSLGVFLESYCADLLSDTPILTRFTVKKQVQEAANENGSEINNSSKRKCIPKEAFPELIRLVHGNIKKRVLIAKEFQKYLFEQLKEIPNGESDETLAAETDVSKPGETLDSNQISLRKLEKIIKSIATYKKSPDSSIKQYCWWVHDEIREKYGLTDALLPNLGSVSDKQIDKTVKTTSIKKHFNNVAN